MFLKHRNRQHGKLDALRIWKAIKLNVTPSSRLNVLPRDAPGQGTECILHLSSRCDLPLRDDLLQRHWNSSPVTQ
jgi:hypothetical protein